MTKPEKWVSQETEQKERHYRGLVRVHAGIVKDIHGKYFRNGWRTPGPYSFFDFHGGPGNLVYNGAQFLGSPLITLDELARAELGHQTWHFEHDPPIAAQLAAAVARRVSNRWGSAHVAAVPFERGVLQVLDVLRRQEGYPERRYGLAYSDPISDPIPVETFNRIAREAPKIDFLAYVSATNQYKRANANGQGHGRRLADDIAAVEKRYVLIRQPHRAEQYTFILWSNWDQLFDWRGEGFHRLDKPGGQDILERLDCTKPELHARRNTPLPFPPTEPTPSTSGIQDSSPSAPWSSSGPVGSASDAASDRPLSPITSPTRRGEPSTFPRTLSPSVIPATAERMGRSGDGEC